MPFYPVHHYYGYSAGDWLWSIFGTLLFVAFVVAAVMLLARAFAPSRRGGPGAVGRPVAGPGWFGPGRPGPGAGRGPAAGGAERILAERYARGEIGEEEFRERLEVLRRVGSEAPARSFPSPPVQPPPPPPAPPSAGASAQRPPSEGTEGG